MLALISLAFIVSGWLITDATDRLTSTETGETLAIVGDRTIQYDEIERPLTTTLYKQRKQIYELKNAVLENRIDELLLEINAEALDITVDELEQKVRSQIPLPADSVVNHYFENGLYPDSDSTAKSEIEIKTEIQHLIHTRDSNQILVEYIEKLRERIPIQVLLKPPLLPTNNIRIEGDPTRAPQILSKRSPKLRIPRRRDCRNPSGRYQLNPHFSYQRKNCYRHALA